jgi:type II secretory pathway pseudopilin PulG
MPRSRNRTRHRGFTLVSALVALAIIGISAAVAGPALWEIAYEIKLKQAAREAITAMRSARYRAINEVREFGVLARLPDKIQIFEGTDPLDANAVRQEILLPGGIYISAPAAAVPPGATHGFATNAAGGYVIFNVDGTATASGGIRLSNPNEHYIEVELDPATTARMQLRTWNPVTGEFEENG